MATPIEDLRRRNAEAELGGGAERIAKQHEQGKLTARERVALLLDEREPFVEVGLFVAYDQYGGQAPGAGVVTTRGHVHWVVTEYGAVNLFGRSLRERAAALISIAHPDVRGELQREFAVTRHVVLGAIA